MVVTCKIKMGMSHNIVLRDNIALLDIAAADDDGDDSHP